jgi:hypothetical protein
MSLCQNFSLKDCYADFCHKPLSIRLVENEGFGYTQYQIVENEEENKRQEEWQNQLKEKSEALTSVTLVDCNICGLSKLLDGPGKNNLE